MLSVRRLRVCSPESWLQEGAVDNGNKAQERHEAMVDQKAIAQIVCPLRHACPGVIHRRTDDDYRSCADEPQDGEDPCRDDLHFEPFLEVRGAAVSYLDIEKASSQ